MREAECIEFLRWCLPRLGLRWKGFRKVRRTVCKRVSRRLRELDLVDLSSYQRRLEAVPAEWARLDALCRIPISRLYRDRGVFDCLAQDVLPVLARGAAAERRALRCWSAGCASGEEPLTLRLLWDLRLADRFPDLECRIMATDIDTTMLARAQRGCYTAGAFRDLPADLRIAFQESGGQWCLRPQHRGRIEYRQQDVRREWPDSLFDLVLCRNVAFTYLEPALQRVVLGAITERLLIGGALVLGRHETLPDAGGFVEWSRGHNIYRRVGLCEPSLAAMRSSLSSPRESRP
jgi:chemotaxis protein methyltransferase CheR